MPGPRNLGPGRGGGWAEVWTKPVANAKRAGGVLVQMRNARQKGRACFGWEEQMRAEDDL